MAVPINKCQIVLFTLMEVPLLSTFNLLPDKITIQVTPFCGLVSGTSDRVSEVHCPNVRCPHEIKLGLNLLKQIAIKICFAYYVSVLNAYHKGKYLPIEMPI